MAWVVMVVVGIAGCSFVNFDIWDFPGQINYFDNAFDKQEIFGNCGALVFVIDAQVPSSCFLASPVNRREGGFVCV